MGTRRKQDRRTLVFKDFFSALQLWTVAELHKALHTGFPKLGGKRLTFDLFLEQSACLTVYRNFPIFPVPKKGHLYKKKSKANPPRTHQQRQEVSAREQLCSNRTSWLCPQQGPHKAGVQMHKARTQFLNETFWCQVVRLITIS